MIDIKIKYLHKNAKKPEYATDGSLGVDLSAAIDGSLTIKKGCREAVPTGIAIEVPKGYGGFVFPRSGLSLKKGITLCNAVGVIDNDYTGEIKVPLINLSDKDYKVNSGDRIAQLVIIPTEIANFKEVEELDETERGGGGFGSTGV